MDYLQLAKFFKGAGREMCVEACPRRAKVPRLIRGFSETKVTLQGRFPSVRSRSAPRGERTPSSKCKSWALIPFLPGPLLFHKDTYAHSCSLPWKHPLAFGTRGPGAQEASPPVAPGAASMSSTESHWRCCHFAQIRRVAGYSPFKLLCLYTASPSDALKQIRWGSLFFFGGWTAANSRGNSNNLLEHDFPGKRLGFFVFGGDTQNGEVPCGCPFCVPLNHKNRCTLKTDKTQLIIFGWSTIFYPRSVVAQQIQQISIAIKRRVDKFIFEETEIKLARG